MIKAVPQMAIAYHCQRTPLPFVREHWYPLPGPNCPPSVSPATATAAVITCFTWKETVSSQYCKLKQSQCILAIV